MTFGHSFGTVEKQGVVPGVHILSYCLQRSRLHSAGPSLNQPFAPMSGGANLLGVFQVGRKTNGVSRTDARPFEPFAHSGDLKFNGGCGTVLAAWRSPDLRFTSTFKVLMLRDNRLRPNFPKSNLRARGAPRASSPPRLRAKAAVGLETAGWGGLRFGTPP
jgi:hypothetical protein